VKALKLPAPWLEGTAYLYRATEVIAAALSAKAPYLIGLPRQDSGERMTLCIEAKNSSKKLLTGLGRDVIAQ
jgi:hypothetical protein